MAGDEIALATLGRKRRMRISAAARKRAP